MVRRGIVAGLRGNGIIRRARVHDRLPRSTYYYHTQGERVENITLMRLLDQQYTETPYYGIRRMTAWLRSQGYAVNHKRVARLMHTMGIESDISQAPAESGASGTPGLSVLAAGRADYACQSGLEYGYYVYSAPWWVYLPGRRDGLVQSLCPVVGGVDHHGRGFLSRSVRPSPGRSHDLQISTRIKAHNSPVSDSLGRLAAEGIEISMDGRGRALDNVFVERLWRTVKYEEVYLKDYETPREAMQGLETFFVRYNERRQHQALCVPDTSCSLFQFSPYGSLS